MNITNLTRSAKTNRKVRYALWAFIGLLGLVNVHFSMAELRTKAVEMGTQPGLMDEFIYFVIAASISLFCFAGIGILTNGYVVRWLTSYVGQQIKDAKTPVETAIVIGVSTAVVGILLFSLFQFYTWDLVTTRFGLGLGAAPLLSTASVPAWVLVAGPDIGCTVINVSDQIDGLLKGSTKGTGTPQGKQTTHKMWPRNPLEDLI